MVLVTVAMTGDLTWAAGWFLLMGMMGVSSLDTYYYLFSAHSLDSSQETALSLFPSPFSPSLSLFTCSEHVPVRTEATSWPLSRVLHPFFHP